MIINYLLQLRLQTTVITNNFNINIHFFNFCDFDKKKGLIYKNGDNSILNFSNTRFYNYIHAKVENKGRNSQSKILERKKKKVQIYRSGFLVVTVPCNFTQYTIMAIEIRSNGLNLHKQFHTILITTVNFDRAAHNHTALTQLQRGIQFPNLHNKINT